MYSWIWRHLPGGTAGKLALSLVLIGAVSALLLFVAYPMLDAVGPLADVVVQR